MAGRDVLLNYVLKAQAIEPVAPVSRAYLHNVMVIAKLKEGETAGVYECTTTAQINQYTDSMAYVMLNHGMTKIYLCVVENYADAQALLDESDYKYFTIITDPAFTETPTAIEGFTGVAAWETSDVELGTAYTRIAIANNTAFISQAPATGENMYAAFATLLSGPIWRNQQYTPMPANGATSNLGTAESYFDNRLSFVLNSPEFGNRLAFFANRNRAITAPYIYEEFTLDLQAWALIYINLNMPDYNAVEAAKLESYLLNKATEKYIDSGLVQALTVSIAADQDNFVMSGNIAIAEPKATWRIKAQIQQGGLE